ncbi:MAG: flavodoxin family protein [Candidatus Omnitrophica bacterium]|nr:flavodoxin family protein [Candidatus Omnitrophota bacterium]
MSKKILILNGSPKLEGNTTTLINWFCEGAKQNKADIEIVHIASLKLKTAGCNSCRACQKIREYKCVINDDAQPVLAKMAEVDVIVMGTPLYFFGPSAQLKMIMDRMFSLYKWNNEAGTMDTPLKGKTLVLLVSAFEDIGLDITEKPFELTAAYTKMAFKSLLVPNAGTSGEIHKLKGVREKAIELGQFVGAR